MGGGDKINLDSHLSSHQLTNCRFEDRDANKRGAGAASQETQAALKETVLEQEIQDPVLPYITNIRKNISKGFGTAKKILNAIWNETEVSNNKGDINFRQTIQTNPVNSVNTMDSVGNPAVRTEDQKQINVKENSEKMIPEAQKADSSPGLFSDSHLKRKGQMADKSVDKKAVRAAGISKLLQKIKKENTSEIQDIQEDMYHDTSYLLDSYNKTGEYSILGKNDGSLNENANRSQKYSKRA